MSRFSRRDFLKLSSAILGSAAISKVMPGKGGMTGAAGDRPSVLILLFDTMSAPHLSLHGYPRRTTPNLERFAQRATVYHAHYSNGTYTTPGTASILTGLLPWTHRAVNPAALVHRGLTDNNVFRAVGREYHRIAYSQNLWAELFLRQFDSEIEQHLPAISFAYPNPLLLGEWTARDTIPYFAYEDFLVGGVKIDTPYPGSALLGMLDIAAGRGKNVDAELRQVNVKTLPFNGHFYYKNRTVFDGILETVREAARPDRPYFGYFHLWSPHGPYAPQGEFASLFDDDLKLPRKPRHPLVKKGFISNPVLNAYCRAYDQYIADLDAEFGRLMDAMEQEGLLENTCVVVLSDHGQLFERGVHGHSSPLLYDQGIHVPLIISVPGQAERRDVYEATSNVDLLPTLAALTGGEPPARLEGRVLPGLGIPSDDPISVFCVDAKENPAFRPFDRASFALIRGAQKLIWYLGYPEVDELVELYDLHEDPHELNDLSAADPLTTKRMLEELKAAREAADEPYRR